MATNMDKSLDEILGDQRPQHNNRSRSRNNNQNRSHNNRRRDNNDFPRDGVKKVRLHSHALLCYTPFTNSLSSEWVHDRYEDNGRRHQGRRRRDDPDHTASSDPRGTKIRVENIHYELSEEELKSLFQKIGPVVRFQLRYDRAGRSEGVAYVTYESYADAKRAMSEYNGANANGQPISITIMSNESKRNPFENAIMPGRSLADRISAPRSRSRSPRRHIEDEDISGHAIDRYIPGKSGRSRSPMNGRRNQGRRPGARRDQQAHNNGRGGQRNNEGSNRPRKTQEELDAEMADYFGSGETAAPDAALATGTSESAPAGAADDVDMIE
ncbi:hypothetical protein TD95_002663 [Thielaviopsis punctulata]|uniref:RRM domain-containing protein n=1 Tax=Thielaviopsis punctulata TaxID=72032 RepID=A0A0F4ZJF9_9PEZI|nr:hypothetical protein TD95_002663 [Thielaviopsis punctulata]